MMQVRNWTGPQPSILQTPDPHPSSPRADTAAAAPAPSRAPHAGISAELKATLCKAIAVSGFPPNHAAAVEELARAAGTVTSIEREVPSAVAKFAKLQQDGCEGAPLLVHYKSVKDAVAAVTKLHRQRIRPGKAKQALWARQVNGEGANVRYLNPCRPRATAHAGPCSCIIYTV